MSGPKQADLLIASAAAAQLFHAPDGTPYAKVQVDEHIEVLPIHGAFRAWLRHTYFSEHQGSPSGQAMQDALGVLEARALYEGPQEPVFNRVAEDPLTGSIYIDRGDPNWTAFEILPSEAESHQGWRIIGNPPVNFRRSASMLPLPLPVRGGTVDEIRSFVNIVSSDAPLVYAWLVDAFRPRGPHVILAFQGEQGAAKSFTSRILLALVDPNRAPLRTMPHDPRDLAIMAGKSWALGFDNISKLWPAQSDAICRLATGAGFSTRRLYTDEDEIVFSGARPIVLNGIDNIVERDDLRDRAFLLDLPPVPDTARRAEADLWAGFADASPRILGALLDCVSTALRYEGTVRLERSPRMADTCRWVEAAAPELGWPEGRFVQIYTDNRRAAVGVYVTNDIFITQIMELPGFDGTAKDLLERVSTRVDEATRRSREWPSGPKAARERLRRAAGALRPLGVEVTFARRRIVVEKITSGRDRPDRQPSSDDGIDGLDGVSPTQSAKEAA